MIIMYMHVVTITLGTKVVHVYIISLMLHYGTNVLFYYFRHFCIDISLSAYACKKVGLNCSTIKAALHDDRIPLIHY